MSQDDPLRWKLPQRVSQHWNVAPVQVHSCTKNITGKLSPKFPVILVRGFIIINTLKEKPRTSSQMHLTFNINTHFQSHIFAQTLLHTHTNTNAYIKTTLCLCICLRVRDNQKQRKTSPTEVVFTRACTFDTSIDQPRTSKGANTARNVEPRRDRTSRQTQTGTEQKKNKIDVAQQPQTHATYRHVCF